MTSTEILARLHSLTNQKNIEGMKRFGITGDKLLGIPVPVLRKLGKQIGKNHDLSMQLWQSGIHEARLLAAFIGEPDKVTTMQMDKWVLDFDAWDICDQACGNLFDRTPYAFAKAKEWSKRNEEFVRRAGFCLMATLAVHDKQATDAEFESFFPIIECYATDDRNFVKKAANWALRQIGKRNKVLHAKVILCGERLLLIDSKPAKWIARDALRELRSKAVRTRLEK